MADESSAERDNGGQDASRDAQNSNPSQRPARTNPMEPDIPSRITDIDEAWRQARIDKSVHSARSRYRDFLEDASKDPLLSESPGGERPDYVDVSRRMSREGELRAQHGFEDGTYDEEQVEAERARRKYWDEVIYHHPRIGELGITTDILISEEKDLAEKRKYAKEVEEDRQMALQRQAEGRLRLPYFLNGLRLDIPERSELREALIRRLDQLYIDRNTTVGDLNDALFEEFASEAKRVTKAADFRQTQLDNLSQGILPQSRESTE